MSQARLLSLRGAPGATLLAAAATLALAAGGARLAAPVHAAPADTAPIAVTVADDAITIPDTVAPGYETLAISNTGTMPHNVQLFRLNDGVTIDQVMAAAQAISDDPATQLAFYNLVAPYAGSDMLDPGTSQVVTEDLMDGTYVAADTNGMNGPHTVFTVAGDDTGAEAPQEDFTVTEQEFSFSAPATVNAGENIVEVTNAGQQVHMMVLARLDPGKTVQDVIDFLKTSGPNSQPPEWVHPVPGMPDLAPGLSAYSVLNLDPGMYVMLCFDVDPATMQPHVALGMIGTFTAQ